VPEGAEEESEPVAAAEPPAVPTATAGLPPLTPQIDLEAVKRAWTTLMEHVKKQKRTTHALLLEGMPASLADGRLVISFHERSAFHASEIKKDPHRQVILAALREVFGADLELDAAVVDGPSPEPLAPERQEEPAPRKSSGTHEHSHIKMAKDIFGAEIIEVISLQDEEAE
jgi:DNA polymerase-3 subunit gamma/tau